MIFRRLNIVVLFIIIFAFGLRVFAIDRTPAGLSHDEAYNGIAALEVLNGQYRIFYEINKGIEPLIIWLEGLSFKVLGVGPVQLRWVNVIAGLLTVVLAFPLTARLFNRRIAILAMAGLAVSFWAVFVSRLTLRAVLLPPLLLVTLYFFWLALTPRLSSQTSSPKPTLLYFALSGLLAGVTMYTYLSSRFVPLILITFFGYQLICKKLSRQHWLGALLFVSTWAVVFLPLATYYWENSESFIRRSSQVTTLPYLLEGEFEPVLRNTLRTAGMFTVRGDTTDRYNLNQRPVFDWLNGLLFYLGLAFLIWRLIRSFRTTPASVLLLSSLFFMLLPDFVTDDSPHFLRTIGALPLVYMIWAVGADAVLRRVEHWAAAGRTPLSTLMPVRLPIALVVILLLFTAIYTGYDYFFRWHNSESAREIYGADIAEIAHYLKTSSSDTLPAISAEYYRDLDRFRMDLHFGGLAPFAIWFDGRQSLAFPTPDSGLAPRYIYPKSAPAPPAFVPLLRPVPDESGSEYTVYQIDPPGVQEQLVNDSVPVNVMVSDDLVVLGYRLLGNPIKTGGQFQLLIIWQALRTLPPGTDYTFLVQLVDDQGHLWLQTDGNGYDPGDWQPGIIGLQLLIFHLPGDLPPRNYHLNLQMVNRQTGQPLPLIGREYEIFLGNVPIQLADTPRDVDTAWIPNLILPDPAIGDRTGLLLRGHDLSARQLTDGDKLLLTLYWHVLRQPERDYGLHLFLENQQGQVVYSWPIIEPIGGEWPTGAWPANYWVRDMVELPVTPNVPRGRFILRARWLPLSTGETDAGFSLGAISILP
jgi:4-amino-4-deoxy-L-arabinose transferase-like glycosyltransferase